MRKVIGILTALCVVCATVFSVSYTNNTYQKLAEEYTVKAQKALDAGFYDLAEEYAAEAKKNAALSEEFIRKMLQRSEAEDAINAAKDRIARAKEAGLDPNSTDCRLAEAYLDDAEYSFDQEDYPAAKASADKVNLLLDDTYLDELNAKRDAADALAKAKQALEDAEENGIDPDSPEYNKAKAYYDLAEKAFDDGKYPDAKNYAQKVLDELAAAGAAVKEDDGGKDSGQTGNESGQTGNENDGKDSGKDDGKDNGKEDELTGKEKAEAAIAEAKALIDAARAAGLDESYEPFKEALDYYQQAQRDYADEDWDGAIENAGKVKDLLSPAEVAELLAKARDAARDKLEKAKEALDNAEENGIDPDSDLYKQAVEDYQNALDAYEDGKYKQSEEEADKVLAALDPATIEKLALKKQAEDAIKAARAAITKAQEAGLDSSYEPYSKALDHYRQAQKDYAGEDYQAAIDNAKKVLELLGEENLDELLDEANKERDKAAAEAALNAAKERLEMAEAAGLDTSNEAYSKALEAYNKALDEFEAENYKDSKKEADKVLDLLSDDYLNSLIARSQAEDALKAAKERLDYAESINAPRDFPIAYNAASEYYRQAVEAFNNEDYEKAKALAQKVIDALAEIHEITPLPKFYIVRPWAETKDCFWNISGRSYVYNNPWLWENLYEANKDNIPDRNNPNLILPGMKMEIPSITGEYRDGVYSPDVDYETYSANR
ncbi:MAG: hypothetical protein J6Y60_12715 [Treponema sp.]|nr:hypothetical protein [Treponema sp.]